jgi:hypothetical protein
VSPTAGVSITDEEKAEDRLADENDALELVNATTTMLDVTHDDDKPSAATLHAEAPELAASPAASGAHTPGTGTVEPQDSSYWPQGAEAIVAEAEEAEAGDAAAADRLGEQARSSLASRPAHQPNQQHQQQQACAVSFRPRLL